MLQKNKKLSALVLIFAFLIVLSSCSLLGDSDIEMQEIYQIKEGACGELILKEKLADNFDKALKKIEKEKTEFYQSYCPDEPCRELEFETYQIEVEGEIEEELDFKAVRVLDKRSGLLIEGVHEVITSNGYHYQIAWCPD